ncbi:hypothetical protein MATL_G00252150 [Megalops atlanticus]|uniref:Cystein proteinase inhibitor protein salarin n=1 Tax=Megalops atlanticus TaxID=7932 RepID=A0A9D3T016_MEGAT|nr:hypothetical protein MATL_G00252150 [Megalops atlanticus]
MLAQYWRNKASALFPSEMDVDKEFEDWKIKFEKSYATPEEEAERKKIWLATRAMVIEHNKKHEQGLVTWTMGLNHFADLRPEEMPCGLIVP